MVRMRNSGSSLSTELLESALSLFLLETGASVGEEGNGGIFHSGRNMISQIASRKAGLSVPEMDCWPEPFSRSSKPVHHLFKMTVLRSRSSALNESIAVRSQVLLRNGSKTVLTILAFCRLVLDWKVE